MNFVILRIGTDMFEKNKSIMIKKNKCVALIIAVLAVIAMVSWDSGSQIQGEATIAGDVPEGWKSLFDGKSLSGWKILRYGGDGEPHVKNGALVIPMSVTGTMTGLCWVGDSLPVINYEVYYEARRTAGSDIFAGLTFPYYDTSASLIFGGWNGIVNGLSSIDGLDASGNETTQFFSLMNNYWYAVRLRVTADSIRAMVGAEKIVDIATAGKDIHTRSDILETGFTLWTYVSTGEIRNLRIRKTD